MGLGRVTANQMSLDAKLRVTVSQKFDLSSAITTGTALLLYSNQYDIIIKRISLIYVTETAAAASTVDIGTLADDDAVVDAWSSSASATVGTDEQLTLASTLASTRNDDTTGLPRLPKDTPLLWKNSASGGAGEVHAVIEWFPLDTPAF